MKVSRHLNAELVIKKRFGKRLGAVSRSAIGVSLAHLFSPFTLREVTFKNRIAVSPMSQYRAVEGVANDWHLVHLGRFAMGGAGLVYAEATAVEDRGKRTHGDLGLWNDAQVEALKPVTSFLKKEGAIAGVQLSHAGRKASERRPWHGETPVDAEDLKQRQEMPWQPIGPSPVAYADGWPVPTEMSAEDIYEVIAAFGSAAKRSYEAGFEIIEIYAAHGFLIHQFLSPVSNKRADGWGGSLENRQRFAVEVAKSVRANWPEHLPLAFRLSATDWLEDGLELSDTVTISRALKDAGVDMIDCSSGGIGGRDRPKRMTIEQGFQAPFAEEVRREADISTMAVGFLWDAEFCEELVREEKADMIALARELLADPNWPLHAADQLSSEETKGLWPIEFGWWLQRRDRLLKKLGVR